MRIIYRPTGRALEYSYLALNPWGKSWCSHDCDYCYVPGACRMTREQWRKQPFKPVRDLLKRLRADCRELADGKNEERVLCCFMGDLYSPEAVATGLPRKILETFREFDVPFQVLTKGGTIVRNDFDLYGPNDAYAATMVFLNHYIQGVVEPKTARPEYRMDNLWHAHRRGIESWVSLEPVLDPEVSLEIIRQTHEVVSLYKIGVLNHDKARAAAIDWRAFGAEAVRLCEGYGVPYYIKADLAKHMEGIAFTNTDTRRVQR